MSHIYHSYYGKLGHDFPDGGSWLAATLGKE